MAAFLDINFCLVCRQGQHDAISAGQLSASQPPAHCAVDGSCASAALPGGFTAAFVGSGGAGGEAALALARPWLAASHLTGAPWKRLRADPYAAA